MSNPQENRQDNAFEGEEFSTIFSQPQHEDEKERKNNKGMLIRIVSALAAVAVLAGATFAVIKLIPEKSEDTDTTRETINVISVNSADVKSVKIKNSSDEINFISQICQDEDSSEICWSVDGIDSSLTDSSVIEQTVSYVFSVSAIKEMTDKTGDYGFDNPVATATVTGNNKDFKNYTVTIGKEAPAALGNYCKISTDDKIYLVETAVATALQCQKTDFGITTGFTGVDAENDNVASCFKDGAIISFDYVSLSGKKYPQTLKIVMQKDESINSYFAYKITSPSVRIADDTAAESLIDYFKSGITSSGVYSYSTKAEEIKKYGLDNPDAVLELSLNGHKFSLKFSTVDEYFCAMMADGDKLIHKVALSSVDFMSKKAENYFSTFIILENLSGLNGLKAEISGGKTYNFNLKYTEADEEKNIEQSYQAILSGKELDIENFKKFYQGIISMSPVAYESKNINKVALKLTFKHSAGTPDTVLEFKPYSSQRYQVNMNSTPMGQITAAVYEELLDNLEKAATNKAIA